MVEGKGLCLSWVWSSSPPYFAFLTDARSFTRIAGWLDEKELRSCDTSETTITFKNTHFFAMLRV